MPYQKLTPDILKGQGYGKFVDTDTLPEVIAHKQRQTAAESAWKKADQHRSSYLGGRSAGTQGEFEEWQRRAGAADHAWGRYDAISQQGMGALHSGLNTWGKQHNLSFNDGEWGWASEPSSDETLIATSGDLTGLLPEKGADPDKGTVLSWNQPINYTEPPKSEPPKSESKDQMKIWQEETANDKEYQKSVAEYNAAIQASEDHKALIKKLEQESKDNSQRINNEPGPEEDHWIPTSWEDFNQGRPGTRTKDITSGNQIDLEGIPPGVAEWGFGKIKNLLTSERQSSVPLRIPTQQSSTNQSSNYAQGVATDVTPYTQTETASKKKRREIDSRTTTKTPTYTVAAAGTGVNPGTLSGTGITSFLNVI